MFSFGAVVIIRWRVLNTWKGKNLKEKKKTRVDDVGLLTISDRPPRTTPFFYRQTWRSLPSILDFFLYSSFPAWVFFLFPKKPSAIKEEENKKWKQMTTIWVFWCSHTFYVFYLENGVFFFLHWTVVVCGRFRWYRWKRKTWANNDLVSSSHRFRGGRSSFFDMNFISRSKRFSFYVLRFDCIIGNRWQTIRCGRFIHETSRVISFWTGKCAELDTDPGRRPAHSGTNLCHSLQHVKVSRIFIN